MDFKAIIKNPWSYRVVYDGLLGWGIEHVAGNCTRVISEKVARWFIGYMKRYTPTYEVVP